MEWYQHGMWYVYFVVETFESGSCGMGFNQTILLSTFIMTCYLASHDCPSLGKFKTLEKGDRASAFNVLSHG